MASLPIDHPDTTAGNQKPGHSPWLRLTGLMSALAWAGFVIIRYAGVDNDFLLPFLRSVELEIFRDAGAFGLYGFTVALTLGYAGSGRFRARTALWPIGVCLAGWLMWTAWTPITEAWRDLSLLRDGLRASLLMFGAAALGGGFGLGSRLAGHQPVRWLVGFLLALPFLLITVKAAAVAELLAPVWLFLLAEAIGCLVLTCLSMISGSRHGSMEISSILNVAVGLPLMSLMTLGLGLLGLVDATSLILALAVMTVLSFPRIRTVLSRLLSRSWYEPVSLSLPGWSSLSMLAALFAVFWIAVLAPEVGSDALGGRVAAPALWLREGRISPAPEMNLTYTPFLTAELLYLLAMPLTGLTAAKVMQFGVAALLLASAYREVSSRQERDLLGPWLFAFWGSTLIWWQLAWGFVDLIQLFFYYTSILAMSVWVKDTRPVWLATAGILGGAASLVKLNGAGVLGIAGLVVVWVTLKRTRSIRRVCSPSLWLAIPALLIMFPWVLRSYELTGNPVFPFANQFFQSPLAPLEMSGAPFGPGLVFPDMLTIPWDLFFEPGRFVELGSYNPFLLAMAPLALLGLVGATSRQGLWLLSGSLGALAWLVTEQNARYSFYAAYLLTLALGLGWARLQEVLPGSSRRILQWVVLGLVLGGFGVHVLRPSAWMWRGNARTPFPTRVVLGKQTDEDYLAQIVRTYPCADWLNRHYGDRAKVWQLPGVRDHLYFSARVTSLPHGTLPLMQPLVDLLRDPLWTSDPIASHQRLVDLGYSHLMYASTTKWLADQPEAERRGILSPLLIEQAYLQLECAERDMRLYKIRRPTDPAP